MTRSQQACLIVCERTSRWADRVRRYGVNLPVALIETRSLTECSERLAEQPAAIVGLELTETSLDRALAWWMTLARRFPQANVIALFDHGMGDVHEFCQELGALDVMRSELDSMRLPDLVCRYLSQASFATLNEDSPGLLDEIRARLPWAGP
jgi:hypothetical protein